MSALVSQTPPGTTARVALADATEADCKRLRARFGLAPHAATSSDPAAMHGVAYCGREFRAYPTMRIADALRFYATLHARWNDALVREALALAGLDERFEIGRMKRAYQRALVLAFALASEPDVLVVENAEEFDEDRSRVLLERALEIVPRAIVTYGAGVVDRLEGMPSAIEAGQFDAATFAVGV